MGNIGFMIGAFEAGLPLILQGCISNHKIVLEDKKTDKGVYLAGVPYFANQQWAYSQELWNLLAIGKTTEEQFAKKIVEDSIKKADDLGGYNPIGKPYNSTQYASAFSFDISITFEYKKTLANLIVKVLFLPHAIYAFIFF